MKTIAVLAPLGLITTSLSSAVLVNPEVKQFSNKWLPEIMETKIKNETINFNLEAESVAATNWMGTFSTHSLEEIAKAKDEKKLYGFNFDSVKINYEWNYTAWWTDYTKTDSYVFNRHELITLDNILQDSEGLSIDTRDYWSFGRYSEVMITTTDNSQKISIKSESFRTTHASNFSIKISFDVKYKYILK